MSTGNDALDEALEMAEMQMMEALEFLDEKFRSIRTGRPTTSVVTHIPVDAYGATSPMQQLGAVQVADANSLVIRPFDPSILGNMEKAIVKSDLGINPVNDGKMIRLVFPPLSEERRKQQANKIRDDGENAKIRVRNARRDANKAIDAAKKDGAPEDVCKRQKDNVQELTDDHVKKIDEAVEKKIEEISEV